MLDVAGTKSDVRLTLSALLDGSKFHEFKELFGTGLVCGYGRIDGHLVGIVGNNGNYDANSALKGTHFVHLATEREVPIIFLQNSLFHDDYSSETWGKPEIDVDSFTLRARASLIAAVSVSKVKTSIFRTIFFLKISRRQKYRFVVVGHLAGLICAQFNIPQIFFSGGHRAPRYELATTSKIMQFSAPPACGTMALLTRVKRATF